MKAIVCTQYGGPEALQLKEVPKPIPAHDEVLIKVHATSINDWDWGILNANSFIEKAMAGSAKKPRREILGSDVSGVVEAVGNNVQKFKPGDAVFGDLSGKWGGFAEYVCAKENKLALKPASMSFEEAAAIPQAGMLMVQGLIDKGQLKAGQKLLINGAGGGVGTFGIQLAKSLGVTDITAVDSAGKLDMLRTLGATHVIDYTTEDFTKSNKKYDLILDVKTNRPISQYLRVLNPGGKYVTVGGSLGRLLKSVLLIPAIKMVSKKRVILVVLKPNKDLAYMSQLFEEGKVKPVIDGYYTLEQTPEAFKVYQKAEHKGKLVISIQ